MFHDPAEEFSQVFHERKMALNREKSQKHMVMELTVWVTPICRNEMKPVNVTEVLKKLKGNRMMFKKRNEYTWGVFPLTNGRVYWCIMGPPLTALQKASTMKSGGEKSGNP